MCGGSAFKAAREDSNEQKKYDETGLVVSSCKHCVVPYAINMFKGESWTHTAFMHNEAMKVTPNSSATTWYANTGNG
jgi:hypothetical protein